MEELIQLINTNAQAFNKAALAQAERGNKAAGRRARKYALELIAALKEFRKQSMAKYKGQAE